MSRPVNRFRRVWTIAGVFLLLVVSVPVFVGAVHGQSVTDPAGGSQTSLLVTAIVSLNQQIDALSSEVRSLRSAVGSIGQAGQVAPSTLGEGMPECLMACRSKLSTCLLTPQASSTSAFGTTAPVGVLDACRNQANTCMNQCVPRTTPVLSCQDRCAVSLGACVVSARGDTKKLSACRDANGRCLIAACRPGTTTDSRAFARIPTSVCADSCDRDLQICRRAAAYDSAQLTVCDTTARTCREKVCATTTSVTPSSPSTRNPSTDNNSLTPNTTPGQQLTIQCENSCTATFNDCRATAGDSVDQLAACNTSYGGCRNTCLTQIGGGF